jgi:hypothetical protein
MNLMDKRTKYPDNPITVDMSSLYSKKNAGWFGKVWGIGPNAYVNIVCTCALLGTILGGLAVFWCLVKRDISALQAIASILSCVGGFIAGYLTGQARNPMAR